MDSIHRLCLGIIPLILIASCTTLGRPLKRPWIRRRKTETGLLRKSLSMVKFLIANGANMNTVTDGGKILWLFPTSGVTPLRYAKEGYRPNKPIIDLLFENGAK
jgi:hypothetical protein